MLTQEFLLSKESIQKLREISHHDYPILDEPTTDEEVDRLYDEAQAWSIVCAATTSRAFEKQLAEDGIDKTIATIEKQLRLPPGTTKKRFNEISLRI